MKKEESGTEIRGNRQTDDHRGERERKGHTQIERDRKKERFRKGKYTFLYTFFQTYYYLSDVYI